MAKPTNKTIADARIEVDTNGWPRWTRVEFKSDVSSWIMNEEEARDLLYAMQRVVAYLDEMTLVDRQRGIIT